MKKIYNPSSNRSWIRVLIGFFVLFLVPPDLKAQVAGTVFKDFNASGSRENLATFCKPGIAGVVVEATKPDGTLLTVSHASGGTHGQIRLEFILPDAYDFACLGATGLKDHVTSLTIN